MAVIAAWLLVAGGVTAASTLYTVATNQSRFVYYVHKPLSASPVDPSCGILLVLFLLAVVGLPTGLRLFGAVLRHLFVPSLPSF